MRRGDECERTLIRLDRWNPRNHPAASAAFVGAVTSAQRSGQETLDKLVNQYTWKDSVPTAMITLEGGRGDLLYKLFS